MARILATGKGVAVLIDRTRSVAVLQPSTASVRVADTRQVSTVRESVQTIAIAAPGPRGPAGAPGGTSDQRIADGALGGHRLVRSTGADTVGYADCTNEAHGDDTQGMTLGAALDGAPIDVQRAGSVQFNGWAWTQGEPVFLGAGSVPTQTPPSPEAGDAFSQVIGHAEAPDVLYLDIQPPIYF